MEKTANQRIKILLVDDHNVVREGLRRILELDGSMEVIGEAKSGAEAISRAVSLSPDVVIMDLKMPGMDGITATREMKQRLPRTQVLVLTLYAEDYVEEALEAGASGYLLKDSDCKLITMAIHQVHEGLNPIAPSLTRQLISDLNKRAEYNSLALTERQTEMLQLIAEGVSSKEIGAKFFISPSTVKREIRHIFDKLGVNDRAHAVSIAIKRKLIKVTA
jgi:DNA-binding NarL/FixJ family response regulator